MPDGGGKDQKKFRGGGTSEKTVEKWDEKLYWSPFQRRWYTAEIAKYDEIPIKLKNKLNKTNEDVVLVKYLFDDTYSFLPKSKIEVFSTTAKGQE